MKKVYLFFILLTCLTSPLLAQDSYEDFERGLNLSGPQRAKIEDIKKKYMAEWKTINREIMGKRMELRDLYRNPNQSGERIERLHREIFELESLREDLFGRYKAELSKVLDEKQKERYNDFSNAEKRRGMSPMGIRRYGR
ncbi:MAG: Spy/CpxP family protein refolding chaperone [Syntrophorhabdaceae bacterium]|nr:Spy/CpxP family protein refolding chaperone [Syntrophorhabdaceae bacterium]